MTKNTPFDHKNSKVEINILNRLYEGDSTADIYQGKQKIIKLLDEFFYRGH